MIKISQLRVLPDEVHYKLLSNMKTPEQWINYSKIYTHLITDYFCKKLIVTFPNLTKQNWIDNGWDEKIYNIDFNFTLIHAFNTNNIKLVRKILNYGGNVYQKYYKKFLFFFIVELRKFDMARLFLEKGFNINIIYYDQLDYINVNALMFCSIHQNIKSIQFLLENGADVNAIIKQDCNTLPFSMLTKYCYRFYKNPKILQLLIKYGADYNLKNNHNKVALHFLIDTYNNFEPLDPELSMKLNNITIMLKHFIRNTDVTIVTGNNKTFLHLLCNVELKKILIYEKLAFEGFKSIIMTLLVKGVPINFVDDIGYTAYDYADENNLDFILELLVEKGGRSATQDEKQLITIKN
jgi:hypothetical protein